jgi:hypothetical protein
MKIKQVLKIIKTSTQGMFSVPCFVFYARRGFVSIVTVLVVGTVIMETALVGLEVAYLVREQGIGVRSSYSATVAAESGVEDVLLRIARNKSFVPPTNPYTLIVGNFSTQVSVVRSNIDTRFSQYTITSVGVAFSKRVTLRGVFVVDDYAGSVSSQSYTEVSN